MVKQVQNNFLISSLMIYMSINNDYFKITLKIYLLNFRSRSRDRNDKKRDNSRDKMTEEEREKERERRRKGLPPLIKDKLSGK